MYYDLLEQYGIEPPFDASLLTIIMIVLIVVMVLACALAMLSSLLIIAKPDAKKENEIQIDGNNSQALSRAVLDGNKLLLQRASRVNQISLDVIAFAKGKKKKHSYNISFNGDYAAIDLEAGVTDVKLIVLTVDGNVINKKKIGYPNDILLIVSSALIVIGVSVIGALHAYYYSWAIEEASIIYGVICYGLPIVLAIILGVANFLVSKIITKSFNKGGR